VTETVAEVGLLTGGSDKPYALGLASELASQGVKVDFIGSDELDCPEVRQIPGLTFLNLRGDQGEEAAFGPKILRIAVYYARLITYAAFAKPRTLHILWNNKFELFDRIALMLLYRLCAKRVVLTAHNVNAARRDSRDSWMNRMSLQIQYRLCHHIFVHTDRMKGELIRDFGLSEKRITVIPFGINDTIPKSALTRSTARQLLSLRCHEKAVLFFGQIAPYKGLEFLVSAVEILAREGDHVRLIIAGKVKRGYREYWQQVQQAISDAGIGSHVIQRIRFIPDQEVEQYFKATDVVVVPYTEIFQSGVPFLAFSFGLPVIATDVGSLREDVIDGQTGFLCRPQDPVDLAAAIRRYFASELYRRDAGSSREEIREFACGRHSWTTVGELTRAVYMSAHR
jgi:glycosyltransferase involved in cell wall biosynthesis